MKTFSRPRPRRLAFSLLFLVLALACGPRCGAGWANFENTGSLAEARLFHTATLLPNGKVLVAGGINDNANPNSLATAELYDLAQGTGHQLAA